MFLTILAIFKKKTVIGILVTHVTSSLPVMSYQEKFQNFQL